MMLTQEKPPDLRVRRTRHMLQQALMELMATQSFQTITLQDITDKAMVNRATFYDHFVDKYALLEHSVQESFKQTLHSQVPEPERFSEANLHLLVVTMCEFLSQLRNHCRLTDQHTLLLVQTKVTALVAEILVGWLHDAKRKEALSRTPAPVAAAAVSWSIYGVALYWSQQEKPEPVKTYVTKALPLVRAGLGL